MVIRSANISSFFSSTTIFLVLVFTLQTTLFFPLFASALPSSSIGYQGYMSNSSNLAVDTAGIGQHVIVSLYSSQTPGGTLIYQEAQNISISKGYFSINIGSGATTGSGLYSAITQLPFDQQYFVELNFDTGPSRQ